MLNLLKDKKYVLACSYGPDSMALFDMLLKEGFCFVVAHVNYHKRDVSNFEEESLRKYCKDNDIQIEVLDTAKMKVEKNFQNWAREVRYDFFKKVLVKHHCDALLVAHQQDDVLETYIMQKERQGIVKYWGIAEKTALNGMKIIRPLLGYSKQELLDYDSKNNVPYSIDVSNLSSDYTRNKIRHEVVEKLTAKERDELLSEIKAKNSLSQLTYKTRWKVDEFVELADEEIVFSISNYLNERNQHKDLSSDFVREIKKASQSSKAFVEISLTDELSIVKDYDVIRLFDKNLEKKYSGYLYHIAKNTYIDDELFEIDLSNADDRNIKSDDYPLMVRPVCSKDKIIIRDYECSVNRLFIDWKVPHLLRNCWPGIYNRDGKLIYIPRYRENFVDNHSSKFVIKFVKDYLI